jgi:hypothetical protein
MVRIVVQVDGEERVYELSPNAMRALEAIAARNKLGFVEALQQAILNEDFIEEQQLNGAKLLIEKNDEVRELAREPVNEPVSEPA